MRILHVNKFLYRRGGAEAYMQDLAALQEDAGHTVAYFGMAHPLNPPLPYAAHFPAHVELEPPPPGVPARVRAVGRILWSTSAPRGLDAVLDDFRPDVVHLHNIYHQLSPSVLRPLARRGVPAVMTLHDYKLACPTYQFLDHGRICEACLGGHFHHAVRRRCKDDSVAASAVSALELYLHTRLRAYAPVRRFICPSRFLAGRMAAAGVFPDRMRTVPHFIDVRSLPARTAPGTRLVFAGRLAPEKGVDVLVEALGLLPGAELDIAGDGLERGTLEALAARVAPGRVHFLGRLGRDAVLELVRGSALMVLPARWYENQPMSVLEAFATGVPVVGSALGGLTELIDDGVDGALVPPNDPAALAATLRPLLDEPARLAAMGAAGRAKVERDFAPGRHLERIEAVYAEAGARVERRAA